jgi:general secretion pathway protein C
LNLVLHGRRLSAAITLVTLTLSALFMAKGTTALVAGALLPPQPVSSGASQTRAEQPPGTTPPDTKEILKRNIFDPTTGPLWPPKPPPTTETSASAEAAPVPEELQPGQIPPPCEGNLRMISAMHFDAMPEWSFAALSTGGEENLLYRKGGRVDDKEIVEVLPKAVFLRQGNGRLCSVAMFFDKAAAANRTMAAAAPVPPPTAAAPATLLNASTGGISEAEMDQNIHAVSEGKYTVQKTFVDKILQNQAQIMSSARIVPHEENGQVVGVKMYGIRRNSLLGKLGMQNGDLLRTINGFEMSSPDTALEAYARLRSASNLSVAVVRRGQAMNLQYDVQ